MAEVWLSAAALWVATREEKRVQIILEGKVYQVEKAVGVGGDINFKIHPVKATKMKGAHPALVIWDEINDG